MKIIICILTIIICFNSIRYSLFEIKNKNKLAGATVAFLGLFQLIFTNIILFTQNV